MSLLQWLYFYLWSPEFHRFSWFDCVLSSFKFSISALVELFSNFKTIRAKTRLIEIKMWSINRGNTNLAFRLYCINVQTNGPTHGPIENNWRNVFYVFHVYVAVLLQRHLNWNDVMVIIYCIVYLLSSSMTLFHCDCYYGTYSSIPPHPQWSLSLEGKV